MNRSSALLIGLLSLMTMLACDKAPVGPDQVRMQIADRYKDCVGMRPQKCLQIKENGDTNWSLFYWTIEGFTYEEGYEYVLLVRRERIEELLMDGPGYRYSLLKQISKTKQ